MATSMPADAAVSPKLSDFTVVDADYKMIDGAGIPASILTPKNAKAGKHPLIVRWHGGCLITGHRLFPDWTATWLLQFALKHDAIIITPDYRLLPEVSGLDILDDVKDFFTWLFKPDNVNALLPEGVTADTDNFLVCGESAGGWLSLQSALLPSSRPHISAVVSQYPMIDMRDPWYTADIEKQMMTPPVPQLDRSILKAHLDKMKRGDTITSAIPPDRFDLAISALQQGVFGQWLGDDNLLYPIEALDEVKDLPPVWLLHGKQDNAVPVDGSYKFEKAMKHKLPKVDLLTTYVDGDHGFDNRDGINIETQWIKEGVEFVERYWPVKV